ncbi:hypothetical protein DFS34DRAFT_602496 [Phlyctochytrium arcticum]|nr:hypothetical protein DFS34DRAFT_602496 [Phlyctochytrium arcticum]
MSCLGLNDLIFRRFMWCIIRMENEHTNNIGKFRAVTEIPLPFRVNIIPHTDHLPVTNSSRRTEIPIDPSTTEN